MNYEHVALSISLAFPPSLTGGDDDGIELYFIVISSL